MKKLTVVTVTYNAAKDLERTIQSVISQTYFPHIEYIIIDGNSKDATVEIIKKYESYLSYWASEPDKGIYDAMNKGIKIAKGAWINFMNAGDIFTTNTTVADILAEDITTFDIIYGNYIVAYQTFKNNIYTPKDLSAFYSGMPVNHQSIFMKTGVARLHLYDLAYKIACDYEQLLYFYSSGKVFHHTDRFIAEFAYGGLSTTRKLLYLNEQMTILEKYKPDATLAVFKKKIVKEKILSTLRMLLPIAVFEKLIQFKNILAKK